jgi:hypothetical protein
MVVTAVLGSKKDLNNVRIATSKLNSQRGGGEIGRRVGLKIRRPLWSWGFDSPLPHHSKEIGHVLLRPSRLCPREA